MQWASRCDNGIITNRSDNSATYRNNRAVVVVRTTERSIPTGNRHDLRYSSSIAAGRRSGVRGMTSRRYSAAGRANSLTGTDRIAVVLPQLRHGESIAFLF